MSPTARILAVDDSEEGLFALTTLLSEGGFEPLPASNGREALEIAQREEPDLILLDVNMPGLDGYEVTRRLKSDPILRYIPILLLTARGEIEEIEHGLDCGADGHIHKPYDSRELLARMAAALRMRRLYRDLKRTTEENVNLRDQMARGASLRSLIGSSPAMLAVTTLIEKVRDSHLPVLITGESGTGKELVASAIHYGGTRRERPFIAQNCSAFSEALLESELFGHVKGAFTGAQANRAGLFESADTGTLFLDEIGEMKAVLQAKLLRVLQEGSFTPVGASRSKTVDVRVIAATHRDLQSMIAAGEFREDLFYRLHVLHIHLPPLRERIEDLPLIAEHILVRIAERDRKPLQRVGPSLLAEMMRYRWPGNVRELQNELERISLLSGEKEVLDTQWWSKGSSATISGEVAPAGAGTVSDLPGAITELERSMIARALREAQWNKSEAARMLGISRSNLIAKVAALEIKEE